MHEEWCRTLFAVIKEDGVWAVPRSGLVFRKRGNKLVLVDRMPYITDMPILEAELHAYQQADLAEIKAHFEAAGIEVQDGT